VILTITLIYSFFFHSGRECIPLWLDSLSNANLLRMLFVEKFLKKLESLAVDVPINPVSRGQLGVLAHAN
jgi:hypothetical protein